MAGSTVGNSYWTGPGAPVPGQTGQSQDQSQIIYGGHGGKVISSPAPSSSLPGYGGGGGQIVGGGGGIHGMGLIEANAFPESQPVPSTSVSTTAQVNVKQVNSVPLNASLTNNPANANSVYVNPNNGEKTYYYIPPQSASTNSTPTGGGATGTATNQVDYQTFANGINNLQFGTEPGNPYSYSLIYNNHTITGSVPANLRNLPSANPTQAQQLALDQAYNAYTTTPTFQNGTVPGGGSLINAGTGEYYLTGTNPQTGSQEVVSGNIFNGGTGYVTSQPVTFQPSYTMGTPEGGAFLNSLQSSQLPYVNFGVPSSTTLASNINTQASQLSQQESQVPDTGLSYPNQYQKYNELLKSKSLDQTVSNIPVPTTLNLNSYSQPTSQISFNSNPYLPYGVSGQSYIPILSANNKILAAAQDFKIAYDRFVASLAAKSSPVAKSNLAIGNEFSSLTPTINQSRTVPVIGSALYGAGSFVQGAGESAAQMLNPLNLPAALTLITNPNESVGGIYQNLQQTYSRNPAEAIGNVAGMALGSYAGGRVAEGISSIPVIRDVPTPLPPEAVDVLKSEGLTSPQDFQEVALSNPTEFPSAKTFALKLGERKIPIISKVTGGQPIQVGSAVFDNPESVATSEAQANVNNANPISEGTPTLVKSYVKNLEKATGPESWQTQYAKIGLDIAGTMKDAKVPAEASGLHLEGFTADEDAIINEALAHPQQIIGADGRVYGTASVQYQLGSDFRLPHDVDFKITTDNPDLAGAFAQKLSDALNGNGESKFTAKDNVVYDANGAKIVEVKTNVARPEDIEGALQQIPGLKLGYNAERGTLTTPQGTQIAPIGETVLGKLSSALGIRWEIDPETGNPEITLNSALKRGDTVTGSKDVADAVAITQRYVEAVPNPTLETELNQFKDLAIEHGLVTQEKIDESLNILDKEGITTSYTPQQTAHGPGYSAVLPSAPGFSQLATSPSAYTVSVPSVGSSITPSIGTGSVSTYSRSPSSYSTVVSPSAYSYGSQVPSAAYSPGTSPSTSSPSPTSVSPSTISVPPSSYSYPTSVFSTPPYVSTVSVPPSSTSPYPYPTSPSPYSPSPNKQKEYPPTPAPNEPEYNTKAVIPTKRVSFGPTYGEYHPSLNVFGETEGAALPETALLGLGERPSASSLTTADVQRLAQNGIAVPGVSTPTAQGTITYDPLSSQTLNQLSQSTGLNQNQFISLLPPALRLQLASLPPAVAQALLDSYFASLYSATTGAQIPADATTQSLNTAQFGTAQGSAMSLLGAQQVPVNAPLMQTNMLSQSAFPTIQQAYSTLNQLWNQGLIDQATYWQGVQYLISLELGQPTDTTTTQSNLFNSVEPVATKQRQPGSALAYG